jgi:hypothetical protein
MWKCCSVVVASLMASCSPAHADAFGVHLGSVHSNSYDPVAQRNWNNSNPGVYFRHDEWVVGTYYNSIRKQSYYVGYVYGITSNIDVILGAVSGYDGAGYKAKQVMPMAIPSLHFPIAHDVSARVNLAIGVGKGSATAVNFSLEYKL